ncbi:hypothetical protein GCM10009804_69440 [Kribbella hippodromi]|uniref:PH domain-containing protein n=1 Tax=Kribbella hippodromi TaxID=434347 RepID=A0ABN2EC70_9ACTN
MIGEFQRAGGFRLRSSGRAVAGVLGVVLVLVGVFGFSFSSPNPEMPVVVGGVFVGPVLALVGWAVWLLVPRDRVVVDGEGIARRGRRVSWAEISEIRMDYSISRGVTYTRVQLELVGADGQPVAPVVLPFLLTPGAEHVKPALEVLLAEYHRTARGVPGRIRRWTT